LQGLAHRGIEVAVDGVERGGGGRWKFPKSALLPSFQSIDGLFGKVVSELRKAVCGSDFVLRNHRGPSKASSSNFTRRLHSGMQKLCDTANARATISARLKKTAERSLKSPPNDSFPGILLYSEGWI
jgi:hypothetical protein